MMNRQRMRLRLFSRPWLLRSRMALLLVCGLPLLALTTAPRTAAALAIAPQAEPQPPQCLWFGQGGTDFYTPVEVPAGSPLGEVLRVDFIRTYTPAQVADAAGVRLSLYGAHLYRLLYLSEAPIGEP